MPVLVVGGATLSCSMGTTPGSLSVVRPKVSACGKPAANTRDHAGGANVASFGMCNASANPAVAAATAAALGVHTPAACTPATSSPWSPGASKVTLDGAPALHDGCRLQCQWTGVISVTNAGQVKVTVR